MNIQLRDLNLKEDDKKNIKNKRTIHVKNTYISPYVLYNKNYNTDQLKKLNKIFSNENCMVINKNSNFVKENCHEKKILRNEIFNNLCTKSLENRDEEYKLNTNTKMIQMNSEKGYNKDNERIINENNDLLYNLKKINICNYEDDNKSTKIVFKSNELNNYNRITNSDNTSKKNYNIHENTESYFTFPNKTYLEGVTLRNNITCNIKNNVDFNDNYNLRKSSPTDIIYKCEDSIPLGTILNIHNLDSSNHLTTVMLRNIPNKYTQNMLMAVMNEHFKGLYDFFYLPIDFRNKCNVGYAFINFIHPHYAELFIKFFNNYKLNAFKSNKVCSVTWGRVQGLKANIEHYRNSAIMTIPIPQYKPILFQNGIAVSWPESDGPLPAIKLRSQKY
ncbi:RNA-binding protein mei2 homologue, putative [Plasmodium gallinaceum]|uniref:RNA-binding protein mei2 homologue, putative n=1 Tax=Plasmodium gallinaceum TaxID=5849 RepID=A0A1J1GN07_PLAGA|nr:RNA-binding protein mei2 homologue, putative [Plasmodium gallinaceum]CRG93810.1 RNA-binding protein mei2 homologue, putative [Plasmodium gallinaceum]